MPKLSTPSIQHLARQIQPTAEQIERNLIRLALNPPAFNYNPLYGLTHDALAYKQPLEQLEKGIVERVKIGKVRENFLSLAPLIHGYFVPISADFVGTVSRRFYNAGRDLLIPFDPPLIYGVNGAIHLPWLSFWRNDPLRGERLSLFMTLLDEILGQDPDLDLAKVTILDFSAPAPGQERELSLLEANDIPRLDTAQKTELLERFVEGFLTARSKLANMPARAKPADAGAEDQDEKQPDLFQSE
jgi:hypothetical protein